MDDTSGPVRDATAEALGTLLKVMGERPLNPFIEQLDKIKMDKVSWIVVSIHFICLISNGNRTEWSTIQGVIG